MAVVLTGLTTHLPLLGATRLLEGSSTAASVPSILGYVARATADDEARRGRVVSRFELATLAGFGGGLIAAGPLYQAIGRQTFFLNAVIYAVSWGIFRFAVVELPATSGQEEAAVPAALPRPEHTGWRRYGEVLAGSHALLLAPTWIAVNAVLGLWSSQSKSGDSRGRVGGRTSVGLLPRLHVISDGVPVHIGKESNHLEEEGGGAIVDPDEASVEYRDARAEWEATLPTLRKIGVPRLAALASMPERTLRSRLHGGRLPRRRERAALLQIVARDGV